MVDMELSLMDVQDRADVDDLGAGDGGEWGPVGMGPGMMLLLVQGKPKWGQNL